MPGDTKIRRTSNGWIDVDNPTQTYPSRRLARAARRGATVNTPVATLSQPVADTGLTGLQQRLYDRLTSSQGVSQSEALEVIRNNGYNKAASYGHMRAAGANHFEALQVIALDSPVVSLTYGQLRASGFNHVDALREALRGNDDD